MTFRRSHEDDEAIVEAAMKELANNPVEGRPLPDPSFIWWKAQLLRRFDAERRATEPIEIGERVHIGAAVLGAAALAAGAWSQMASLASSGTAVVAVALGTLLAVSIVGAVAWHDLRGR